ncbi:MAG: SpoIID/LytB domain-containing protein, partial [Nitrospinota bacterium]|nr:SpoIID/LytB domain-containing protein [Nitrospinota bacterium]
MIRASKSLAGRAGPVRRVLSLAALLAVFGFSAPARADLPVRVLLVRGGLSVRVSADAALRVYALAEERLFYAAEGGGSALVRAWGDRVLIGEAGGRPLPAGGVRFRAFGGPIRLNGTPYRGAVDVAASGGRLWVVNTVRLEDYLRGVVGREIPSGWPQAALQAQAVAARTFTLLIRAQADRKAKGRALFHLTAGTGDQVYGGIPAENPAIDAAVAATNGLVLTYGGKIARA